MSAFQTLANGQRWLSWRGELRGDKVTKVPYCTPIRKASATDPATWRVRAEAEACAKHIVNDLGGGNP
jgi:primase-polymerase (primpol)-like protein